MTRHILVPLDGSPLAERALPYAEALARALDARPILARVGPATVGLHAEERRVVAQEEAEEYLERVAGQLAARGLAADVAAPSGHAAETLLAASVNRDADFIVMATHGRGGLGRWVYGSVAARLLAHTAVPVLLVRAWLPAPDPTAPLGAPPRLLIGLDGSAFAEAALPVAVDLAQALRAELVLLRAVPAASLPATSMGQSPDDAHRASVATAEAEARTYLRERVARFPLASGATRLEIRVGDPAEVLLETAREVGATLAVLATHGRTGLPRLLLGSVADAVLRRGRLPLLLVRPQAPAPGA